MDDVYEWTLMGQVLSFNFAYKITSCVVGFFAITLADVMDYLATSVIV